MKHSVAINDLALRDIKIIHYFKFSEIMSNNNNNNNIIIIIIIKKRNSRSDPEITSRNITIHSLF